MSAKKNLTYITGYFSGVTQPVSFENKAGRKCERSVVTLITEDEQILYLEAREPVYKRIKKDLDLKGGELIEVGVVFVGSKKGDRHFNHMYINFIDYVN